MSLGLHLGLDSNFFTNTVLAAGAVTAFIVSAFRRPALGLYYIVPLLPLQTLRFRLHNMPLGTHLIDIVLLGVVIGLIRERKFTFAGTALTRLFYILLIFTYLSLWAGAVYLDAPLPTWISDPRFSDWKNYVEMYVLFFIVIAALRTRRQIVTLLALMCFSVLILNRSYSSTIGDRDFSAFSYDLRDAGPMGYCGVNGLAAFEAQVAVLAISFFLFDKNLVRRLLYLTLVGSSIYSLTFSLSRGGYVAFIAGILFIGILRSRIILVGLIAFLCTWQTLVPGAVRDRVFMTESSDGELDRSAGDRVDLWEDAMQTIRTDPVFGTGIFTYKYSTHLGKYRDTHNLYVKIALETGIFGLVLFFAILGRFFLIGWALFRNPFADDFSKGLGFGVASLMVSALIGNLFGDRWMYIEITGYTCTLVAMAVRLQSIAEEESTEEDEDSEVTLEADPVLA